MFYKVSDAYRLVGWRDRLTGLLDMENNHVFFLPREEYVLLLHMDGTEEVDPNALTREQRAVIQRFLEKKIIQENEQPFASSGEPVYRYFDHVYIETVQWSVTGKCNYDCRHCMLSSPDRHERDLTTEQCLNLIRRMSDCGIRSVGFTGGEPLVREDLPELFRACSEHDIRVTALLTNGALLTEKLLDQIIAAGQRPVIQVSYDGVGKHDWVRGRDGAQQSAEKALLAAREAGFRTVAAMCLFRENVSVLRETVRRLASLSVGEVKVSRVMDLGRWGREYAEMTLSGEEFCRIAADYIPAFIADGKPCNLSLGGYLSYDRDRDLFTSDYAKKPETPSPLYPCGGIVRNPYITPGGQVLPCMAFAGRAEYQDYPNILETPLQEILRDSVWLKTTRTTLAEIYEKNDECRQCPERGGHCGSGCRARAIPDFCGTDPDACAFVKNGRFRWIRDIVEKAGGRYALK